MAIVSKEEKNFEYYPDLPKEIQMMLINELPLNDRYRFTRCSKISKKQVETSKHFKYTLNIYGFSERRMQIKVGHTDHEGLTTQDGGYGYLLDFKIESAVRKLYIRYLRLGGNNEEIWRTEFCSTSLVKYALQYFGNMMKIHQKRVQKLTIGESNSKQTILPSLDYGIESLANLEELEIFINFQISQIIPKLEKPLKVLIYNGKQEIYALTRYEQIHQVRDKLIAPELKLNYENFIRLSAPHIHIHIGEITVEDIHNFLASWKNEELRDNLQSCEWNLKRSFFNTFQLLKHYGVETKTLRTTIKIKHRRGNMAELSVKLLSDMKFRANVNENRG